MSVWRVTVNWFRFRETVLFIHLNKLIFGRQNKERNLNSTLIIRAIFSADVSIFATILVCYAMYRLRQHNPTNLDK